MSEADYIFSREECEDMMQDFRAENAALREKLAALHTLRPVSEYDVDRDGYCMFWKRDTPRHIRYKSDARARDCTHFSPLPDPADMVVINNTLAAAVADATVLRQRKRIRKLMKALRDVIAEAAPAHHSTDCSCWGCCVARIARAALRGKRP
jgi:hypothetical protein